MNKYVVLYHYVYSQFNNSDCHADSSENAIGYMTLVVEVTQFVEYIQ